ncbi:MAG: PTS mannitol transporter subunit IICBA [Propionibacteriaceae bacterium]|nr:PTS mannitol transporter subunit IICBA [Propionibacteriaceae bacterium]
MKAKVQSAGRFLSGMVMPNIGAFIAWGLITACFISTGWIPNEGLATLVDPMLKYLLPILIAYTGGKMVADTRGAVVGSIAAIGVIIGADIPMFMGAMIAGPVGGICIKYFDKAFQKKVKAGFEMLYNNFSAGIIGMLLAILFFLGISPVVLWLTNGLAAGVQFLVEHSLLPVASIFVEPAKVLFLNNAINHGIFTPMGVAQAAEAGKSLFFMIESNPGPGAGLLLAYMLAGKGSAKSSAPGALIIQFFGGIHELYFPYVLMNPVLIIATIAGNMTGIICLQVFNGGLVAAASPGSIFAELIMTPRDSYFANITAIVLSLAVSFVLSWVLLKAFGKDDKDLDATKSKVAAMKAESKGLSSGGGAATAVAAAPASVAVADIDKIIFACDAGMGSSAMGATTLRKKFAKAGITDLEVVHSAVSEIPLDALLVVTHEELKDRAQAAAPNARVVTIHNFIGAPEYDALVTEFSEARS